MAGSSTLAEWLQNATRARCKNLPNLCLNYNIDDLTQG